MTRSSPRRRKEARETHPKRGVLQGRDNRERANRLSSQNKARVSLVLAKAKDKRKPGWTKPESGEQP